MERAHTRERQRVEGGRGGALRLFLVHAHPLQMGPPVLEQPNPTNQRRDNCADAKNHPFDQGHQNNARVDRTPGGRPFAALWGMAGRLLRNKSRRYGRQFGGTTSIHRRGI